MSWLDTQLRLVADNTRPEPEADPIGSFLDAMIGAGYEPPGHIEPGKFIRFAAHGKKQANKSAWCMMFDDCRGGVYGDFVSGSDNFWHISGKSRDELTPEEKAAIDRARDRRRQEIQEGYKRGAEAARRLLEIGEMSPDHPYLKDKQIDPHCAVVVDVGTLAIPIIDIDGNLQNAQRIFVDGSKKFIYEAKVSGGFIPVQDGNNETIIIGEGFATAATIAENNRDATVIAALNAGNLPKVARAVRKKHPDARIVIAGDDDRQTEGNPGRKAATEAAGMVGGEAIFPEWPPGAPADLTDFNDLWCLTGNESLLQIATRHTPDMELLLADDDEEFHAVISQPWLYDDAIPAAAVGISYGASSTGKSFVMLDLGMCLASGRNWHGFEHGTGQPSSVIYVSAEGGRGMRIRKRAWEEKHGIRVPKLRILPKPYLLNEQGDAARFKALLRDWTKHSAEPIAAIIIDTLAQSISTDENAAKDVTAITRLCTEIAAERGSSCILVHHTGKDEDRGMRGSSALKGNPEFVLKMAGDVKSTVRLECEKQKDFDKFTDISIGFDTVTIAGAFDYKGRPVTNLVARQATFGEVMTAADEMTDCELSLIEAYNGRSFVGFVPKKELRQAFFSHSNEKSAGPSTRNSRFWRAVKRLEDRGIAIVEGDSISIETNN